MSSIVLCVVNREVFIINIPSSTTLGTHPPETGCISSLFKPLGGIALLTLAKVSIRVADGLDVLLAYMLRTRSTFCIPCKRFMEAFLGKLRTGTARMVGVAVHGTAHYRAKSQKA